MPDCRPDAADRGDQDAARDARHGRRLLHDNVEAGLQRDRGPDGPSHRRQRMVGFLAPEILARALADEGDVAFGDGCEDVVGDQQVAFGLSQPQRRHQGRVDPQRDALRQGFDLVRIAVGADHAEPRVQQDSHRGHDPVVDPQDRDHRLRRHHGRVDLRVTGGLGNHHSHSIC
jgi:hypothetical protein